MAALIIEMAVQLASITLKVRAVEQAEDDAEKPTPCPQDGQETASEAEAVSDSGEAPHAE